MPVPFQTAVVTGTSRGFGHAIATALTAEGTRVVGVARTPRSDDFTTVTVDATDETVAEDLVRTHRPDLLVLNAGAVPHMAPVQEQTWESFSRNWHTDVRHAFAWTRAALRLLEMPPNPTWFTGRHAVLGFFTNRVLHRDFFRLVPTSANGQPAAVTYERAADGRYVPHGIQVLTLIGDRIARITAFNDPGLVAAFEVSRPVRR